MAVHIDMTIPSLSAPQIFIAYSMKNQGVSDKNLRRGKAGYEANQIWREALVLNVLLIVLDQ